MEEAKADIDAARESGPPEHDESIVHILAAKVFVDWLRNRQQLLVPLTVDLQKLEPPLAETVVYAMVAASEAAGARHTAESGRLSAALTQLRGTDQHQALASAAVESRKPLAHILAGVTDVHAGAVVYASTLLVVDRRKLVDRQFLRYLAARLQLPRDTARSLEQRFRAAA